MSQEQPKNPLHGLTLSVIVTELVEAYGFEDLSEKVAIRCFSHDPSIKSSLKFLRRPHGHGRRSRACTCGTCAS